MIKTIGPKEEGDCKLIYSRNNVYVKRVRSLQTREGRERSGLFVMEGIRPVAQAAKTGATIETLLVSPELLTYEYSQRLVRRLRSAGTPFYRLAPEVYHSLSQAEEPQGIAAVARQRWEPLNAVRPSSGLCWLACEALQSAGNLGTIIRTSEAVGGAGIILIGDSVDPYDQATVRASMGAIFGQKFVRTTASEFAAWKRRNGGALVGTSPAAKSDYHAIAYPKPTILLMGCEKRGLSPEVQNLCDLTVKIPMVGRGDSLNVAVATGILLYELFNQRRCSPPSHSERHR